MVCLEGGLVKGAVEGESMFVSGSKLEVNQIRSDSVCRGLTLALYVWDTTQDRIIGDRTKQS